MVAFNDISFTFRFVFVFQEGDRVLCLCADIMGMWTEYACVPACRCFLMPEAMTYHEAASIPVSYVTAYLMLFEFGNLQHEHGRHKHVLVHMAAGKY